MVWGDEDDDEDDDDDDDDDDKSISGQRGSNSRRETDSCYIPNGTAVL